MKHARKNTSGLPAPYSKMSPAELAAELARYDAEFGVAEQERPLNPAEKRLHAAAAKRGRGRPRVGAGSEKIHISVDRRLLAEADELARREKVSRSELIADGLRLRLAKAG